MNTKMAMEFRAIRPAGGFRVILVDFPWLFSNRSEKGEGKNPNQHYKCMSIDEICAVPLEILAAENCAMFSWNTWPLMPFWNKVIEARGFRFSGLAWEWIKFNPRTGKYAFGPGYLTRKNLEPCLLATCGSPSIRLEGRFFGEPPTMFNGAHSVRDFMEILPLDCIRAPRREHSRKPDEQYERIETLFEGPYVELFSRCDRKGWAAWGNETGKLNHTKGT